MVLTDHVGDGPWKVDVFENVVTGLRMDFYQLEFDCGLQPSTVFSVVRLLERSLSGPSCHSMYGSDRLVPPTSDCGNPVQSSTLNEFAGAKPLALPLPKHVELGPWAATYVRLFTNSALLHPISAVHRLNRMPGMLYAFNWVICRHGLESKQGDFTTSGRRNHGVEK